jgi:PilZ domain-containing protein
MIKQMPDTKNAEEKRRFERIDIAPTARILVMDDGKKVGELRQLARGGFSMKTDKSYEKDTKTHLFTIVEPGEDIHVDVKARIRFVERGHAGFEFVDLDADAAVDVGIIIGKYYEHGR